MKKAIIISGSIILAVLVVFFSLYFISITPKDTGKFSVDEFVEYIQNPHFQTDKNYGEIADYKSAAKAGKAAIAERFENSEGGLFEWMGCNVQYDAESERGKLNSRFFFPFFMCQIPSFTVCTQCADLTRMCKRKNLYIFSANDCFGRISVTI